MAKKTKAPEPIQAKPPVRVVLVADGLQGFVAFEQKMLSLGFPGLSPTIRACVNQIEHTFHQIDAKEDLRLGPMEIFATFAAPGAVEFSVGLLAEDLRNAVDSSPEHTGPGAVESLSEVLGDDSEELIERAIDLAGGGGELFTKIKEAFGS